MFKAGDKVKCIDNLDAEDFLLLGKIYTISHLKIGNKLVLEQLGLTEWDSDRFELIEKEKVVEKQFNPQPGDKIICKNGKEYTCCTLEFLQENIASGINSTKPILGYNSHGWCDWWADGKYNSALSEWEIQEVIPAQKEEVIPVEIEVEQLTYSVEDIRKAVIDDLGWLGHSFDLLVDSLKKVKNPEYMEYLRLKAMFESAETEEE